MTDLVHVVHVPVHVKTPLKPALVLTGPRGPRDSHLALHVRARARRGSEYLHFTWTTWTSKDWRGFQRVRHVDRTWTRTWTVARSRVLGGRAECGGHGRESRRVGEFSILSMGYVRCCCD
jgi:hypothetical protein